MKDPYRALSFMLAFAVVGVAQAVAEEIKLSGPEIKAALTGNTVSGEHKGKAWNQSFEKNGVTTYTSESGPSPGRWRVEGDRYCSQWPPASRWDCYEMSGDSEVKLATVTWIYPNGTRWRSVVDGRE